MKLKVYTLDIPTRPWFRHVFALAALALVVGATTLVYATPKNTFAAAEPVSATKMNQNFVDLDSRLAALEGKSGGTYCGITAPTTGSIATGGFKGYQAAKKLCEAVVGCGATAHMCSGDEIARTAEQTGGVPAPQDTLARTKLSEFTSITGNGRDCLGYTAAAAGETSGAWLLNQVTGFAAYNVGAPTPGFAQCDALNPIACCK